MKIALLRTNVFLFFENSHADLVSTLLMMIMQKGEKKLTSAKKNNSNKKDLFFNIMY